MERGRARIYPWEEMKAIILQKNCELGFSHFYFVKKSICLELNTHIKYYFLFQIELNICIR